jgi:glycosyltransferase involved in cell wall biosynthesis
MKVLMMFPYPPLPPPFDLGGTKRNLPFMLENAKRHEVSVLSYGTKEEEDLLRKHLGHLFRHIRFVPRVRPRIVTLLEVVWLLVTGRSSFRLMYTKSMQRALDEIAALETFDVIHCAVPMFGYFRFPPGAALVTDTHEVTYDLILQIQKGRRNPVRKLIGYFSYRIGRHEEIMLCRKFDAMITTTEPDYAVFRKDLPDQNMSIIQNGAGASFFEPIDGNPEPCSMVFTGLMTHYPNDEGMRHFLDNIFPLILRQEPRAKVTVVGKNPSRSLLSRASANVVVTGFVEDVRPYMARAQVYIIPLLSGGGIRGKALEAMAMRKPIVTTSRGCEGIHLKDGESALFADTPEEFARAVLRLFGDAKLRERIADNAYATVVARYNWEEKGEELNRVYESVVKSLLLSPL